MALLFAVLDIWRFREEMLLLNANQVFNAWTIKIRYSLLAVRCFFHNYNRFRIFNFNRITVKILLLSRMDNWCIWDHNLLCVSGNWLHEVCKTSFKCWWNIFILFSRAIWLVCGIRWYRYWVSCIGLNRSTTYTVCKSKILL